MSADRVSHSERQQTTKQDGTNNKMHLGTGAVQNNRVQANVRQEGQRRSERIHLVLEHTTANLVVRSVE